MFEKNWWLVQSSPMELEKKSFAIWKHWQKSGEKIYKILISSKKISKNNWTQYLNIKFILKIERK